MAALLDSGAAPATAAMDTLLNQAGFYLNLMSEPAVSLRFVREALRLKALRLPEADREVALGHVNLGAALMQTGDLLAAEAELTLAVTLNEAHRAGSADLAASYDLHGQVLVEMGRLPEALRRAQQGLALHRHLSGRWHDDVARSLNNLAGVRDRMGQGAAALRLLRASLNIRRRVLPPGDARLGTALMNTGALWLKAGRADAAEPLLAEALALHEAVYARVDHPERRAAAGWLITCLLVRAERGENRGARQAEAKVLCGRYGFEFAERQAEAVAFARQHRLV